MHVCLQQLQHNLLIGSCAAQIDLVQGMMDCLYAECTPCITDCVLAELEKLGQKYRVALKVAKVRSGQNPVQRPKSSPCCGSRDIHDMHQTGSSSA